MTARPRKGRGALSELAGRFDQRPVDYDAEEAHARADNLPATELHPVKARSIVSTNNSPDVPFNRSINPYQGCEHGCVYCYARPSHSYLDLSPGLDFETKIFYKTNAVERLLAEWQKPGYVCEPITIGANTDPYQPAEKSRRITRELLECFLEHRHPVNLITKGSLITRDIDLLGSLADEKLCSVAVSIPTLDRGLKRIMEPRVPSAESRLAAIEELAGRGIPVSVLVAPVIPAINDHEIETIIDSVAKAGARRAHYIFLRLPHEVRTLFGEWLEAHFPDRAERVLNLVRQSFGGRDYDHRFGRRQTGRGPYAEMLGKRFRAACRRAGLGEGRYEETLDSRRFEPPGPGQLGLDLG
jgi:DNA repair photolyase